MNNLLLHLDPRSPEPLPRQVARQFMNKILEGDVQERESLPPSARLARQHRISVRTIRRAYRDLERRGLIEAREGAPPSVAPLTPEQRRELALQPPSGTLRQQEISREELDLAREIQLRLMPPGRVTGEGFRVLCRSLPARFVAGDFYDVLPHADGSVGVVVADVAGKGLGAGLIMASVKAVLPFVAAERSVDETLREVNRRLYKSLGRREFVALAYARISPGERKVSLANAGVPDPLVLGPRGEVEALEVSGPRLPLGARADVAYEAAVRELSPGEALLMFSDGLPEARRPSGEPLGYDGLVGMIRETWAAAGHRPAAETWLGEMLELVRRSTAAALEDDWTAAVIEPRRAVSVETGDGR